MTRAPGQHYRDDFPRFGLDRFADRVVRWEGAWTLTVSGDRNGHESGELTLDAAALSGLSRVDQVSDFHCVTTWSHADVRWSGYRFRDVYRELIAPRGVGVEASWLVARAHDGFRTRLLLEDAMAPDVLLADRLDDQPLGAAHGAPLRLVAPAHYGYKNPKHLASLELRRDLGDYRPSTPLAFMDHPRARVALEERGTVPGPLLRVLYRPFVSGTIRKFARALDR